MCRHRRIKMMMMTFKRSTLSEQMKKCLQEAKVTAINVKDIHKNSNFELIMEVVISYVKSTTTVPKALFFDYFG